MLLADESFTTASITRKGIADEISNVTVTPIEMNELPAETCREFAKELGQIDDDVFGGLNGDEDEYMIAMMNLSLKYALAIRGREGISPEWQDSLDDMLDDEEE